MLCGACKKLAVLNTNKTCMKCKSAVYNSISVICESCSNNNKCCSACLKKIYNGLENPNYKSFNNGCKSCGK